MDASNTNFQFGKAYFRGLSVSFRDGNRKIKNKITKDLCKSPHKSAPIKLPRAFLFIRHWLQGIFTKAAESSWKTQPPKKKHSIQWSYPQASKDPNVRFSIWNHKTYPKDQTWAGLFGRLGTFHDHHLTDIVDGDRPGHSHLKTWDKYWDRW